MKSCWSQFHRQFSMNFNCSIQRIHLTASNNSFNRKLHWIKSRYYPISIFHGVGHRIWCDALELITIFIQQTRSDLNLTLSFCFTPLGIWSASAKVKASKNIIHLFQMPLCLFPRSSSVLNPISKTIIFWYCVGSVS